MCVKEREGKERNKTRGREEKKIEKNLNRGKKKQRSWKTEKNAPLRRDSVR